MKRLLLLTMFASLAACNSPADEPEGFTYGAPLAAGSPWPKFRRNLEQTARMPRAGQSGGHLWTFTTGKGIFSSPVVGEDGTVYIGSADRYFYAIDKAGAERWKLLTGEIIDSSALLDDRGMAYFGSGDGKVRGVHRDTGVVAWEFAADAPEKTGSYINWFEGNVGILPDGTLIAPNDNYMIYGIDRMTGAQKWSFKSGDQNWSLPAVWGGALFFGNNSVVEALAKNTYSITLDGQKRWSTFSRGTIAASALVSGGRVILGGYDGYIRAYTAASGEELWNFPARDHVYASAASLSDGTLIVPSADGSVYALNPKDGSLRWAFDTREALRSSPAVDGQDRIYLGSGEGRLFVLNANGTRRWAMQLVSDPRNDLNASPALGLDAVIVAGESGEIFSVPYDYCLSAAGKADLRCVGSGEEELPSDGAFLFYTTNFGNVAVEPPAEIDANAALAFSLFVRESGDTRLALLDDGSIRVKVVPEVPVRTLVSGDRKFLTVEPVTRFLGGAGDKVSITITGDYLINPKRDGLRFEGGEKGGTFSRTYTFSLSASGPSAIPLPLPLNAGDPAGVWELSRLAAPLPTVLPSYNQIGFDSLHFLVGLIAGENGKGIAWLVGAKLAEGENETVIDPDTRAMSPLIVTYDAGLLTLETRGNISLEVMSAQFGFDQFRIAARLDETGSGVTPANMHVSLVCADLGFFSSFVRDLGFCNPETDVLSAFGAVNVHAFGKGTVTKPEGAGTVGITVSGGKVIATYAGSTLQAPAHAFGILLVGADGIPVALDYGLKTEKIEGSGGVIARVELTFDAADVPATARVYAIVDATAVASADVTLH